jgi:3-amino-4-hydroxybenzoic acid synthase
MKICWLDVTAAGPLKQAVIEEALHQRIDAIVTDDLADLDALPPTVRKVYFDRTRPLPEDLGAANVVIVDPAVHGDPVALAAAHSDVEFARFVEVTDASTLELACRTAQSEQWAVIEFRDPTKIPLEIVIAAADRCTGSIITLVSDIREATIVFGVLEHGSDGVMMRPAAVGEATALLAAARSAAPQLELVELEVTGTTSVGMGERACIDTCTYFGEDEGILVGSHSKGMILCVSETHPLPYMPTRPFRVNAGAIHSYTLSGSERTNYLSELRAGSKVLAVDIKGQARLATVGRVKIETRPLLSIDAVAPNGQTVNLILQDDWHVRVLGPGGTVLNSTELRPGTKVLGYLPLADRHVGYPISEFCREQ